jgi:hypothetical protein
MVIFAGLGKSHSVIMTGCCELKNEFTALSAVNSFSAPEHTALANELTALSAVDVITTHPHTALTNEHTALIAIDTALLTG